GAHLLHDAHELVPDTVRLVRRRHPPVRPQVGAAHARRHDAHDRVASRAELRIRHLLDTDVTWGMDEGRAHAPRLDRAARRVPPPWLSGTVAASPTPGAQSAM